MRREQLESIIEQTYGVRADYPFEDDLVTGVFRHAQSGKWFALMMNIPKEKIVSGADGRVDVVNLKCAPEVIESLVDTQEGVYRAYHMNKTHWLTVALDTSAEDDIILWLLDISYQLTKPKHK